MSLAGVQSSFIFMETKLMKGIEIIAVSENSLAEELGIKPGDKLCRINEHTIRDSIDYLFYSQDERLALDIIRQDRELMFEADQEDTELGIMLKPFRTTTCRNNCMFCFVKQLPKGLRK